MKSSMKCLFVLLLATAGCISDQVSMRIDGVGDRWETATTRSKYHISSMRIRNPGLARLQQEVGGVNTAMPNGRIFTPSEIRWLERQLPASFDDDGIPVDIDIEVASEMDESLARLPYCLLCGCTLFIVPFYHSWSETLTYRVKASSSPRLHSFTLIRKYESCWSLLGLNNLVPFFPIENSNHTYRMSDLSGGKQASRLEMQAIVSVLCAEESCVPTSSSKKIGQTIGD